MTVGNSKYTKAELEEKIKAVMIGHAVGDALLRREYIEEMCILAAENWVEV